MIIQSVCTFCGVGCRLKYMVENNRINAVMPDPEDPVSKGRPCVKGLMINTLKPNRVGSPLVRGSNGFEKVSWDYAMEMIADKLKELSPENTGWVGSGEITNEDNYSIYKFAKLLGSGNVDSCARLCHAPTVKAFKEAFGVGCSPGKLDDIYTLDTLLLVGTNPMATYPAMAARIMEQKTKGKLKVLYVGFWDDETASISDHIALMRMDHVVFFLIGIINELIKQNGCKDERFAEHIKELSERFSGIVDQGKVKEFADVIAESKSFGVAHGMGITQTYNGTDTVRAVANLAILKNGKVVTNRGKINIQGAGDVGIHPFDNGKTLIEFMLLNPVDFTFISAFNPAVSMPNLKKLRKNLEKMFIVHATPYLNKTSEYADVVLPTPLLFERQGTVTTGENRVRPVRPVVDPPENAKQEWEILTDLGRRLGLNLGFHDVRDVTSEIARSVPRYGNIKAERFHGDAWYDQFVDLPIKERLVEMTPKLEAFEGYPYVFTTARRLPQFNTGDLTSTSERLNAVYNSRAVLMSEKDALKEGLKDGEKIRLVSPVGELEATIKIGYGKVPSGTLVGVFHFEDFPVNILTPEVFDPPTKIPSYKAVPVKIEKLEP